MVMGVHELDVHIGRQYIFIKEIWQVPIVLILEDSQISLIVCHSDDPLCGK